MAQASSATATVEPVEELGQNCQRRRSSLSRRLVGRRNSLPLDQRTAPRLVARRSSLLHLTEQLYAVGDKVLISNLQASGVYNNREATVVGYDPKRRQYQVSFDDSEADQLRSESSLAADPANLQLGRSSSGTKDLGTKLRRLHEAPEETPQSAEAFLFSDAAMQNRVPSFTVGGSSSSTSPAASDKGERHPSARMLASWEWPEWCLQMEPPVVEVYIVDDSAEPEHPPTWLPGEPLHLTLEDQETLLTAEYEWGDESFQQEFRPSHVRQKGSTRTVLEEVLARKDQEKNGLAEQLRQEGANLEAAQLRVHFHEHQEHVRKQVREEMVQQHRQACEELQSCRHGHAQELHSCRRHHEDHLADQLALQLKSHEASLTTLRLEASEPLERLSFVEERQEQELSEQRSGYETQLASQKADLAVLRSQLRHSEAKVEALSDENRAAREDAQMLRIHLAKCGADPFSLAARNGASRDPPKAAPVVSLKEPAALELELAQSPSASSRATDISCASPSYAGIPNIQVTAASPKKAAAPIPPLSPTLAILRALEQLPACDGDDESKGEEEFVYYGGRLIRRPKADEHDTADLHSTRASEQSQEYRRQCAEEKPEEAAAAARRNLWPSSPHGKPLQSPPASPPAVEAPVLSCDGHRSGAASAERRAGLNAQLQQLREAQEAAMQQLREEFERRRHELEEQPQEAHSYCLQNAQDGEELFSSCVATAAAPARAAATMMPALGSAAPGGAQQQQSWLPCPVPRAPGTIDAPGPDGLADTSFCTSASCRSAPSFHDFDQPEDCHSYLHQAPWEPSPGPGRLVLPQGGLPDAYPGPDAWAGDRFRDDCGSLAARFHEQFGKASESGDSRLSHDDRYALEVRGTVHLRGPPRSSSQPLSPDYRGASCPLGAEAPRIELDLQYRSPGAPSRHAALEARHRGETALSSSIARAQKVLADTQSAHSRLESLPGSILQPQRPLQPAVQQPLQQLQNVPLSLGGSLPYAPRKHELAALNGSGGGGRMTEGYGAGHDRNFASSWIEPWKRQQNSLSAASTALPSSVSSSRWGSSA
eukprot:TRINITY_DN51428_c0_g3_i1.p1 TRINITY_DN51428_c0_g3~~TRINITY_DN51428_c0_g3_i1.p1  ORF type:complete len:1055 (+),score=215.67 TRINITY_DN51428_c0_g3_i1:139-3303(+)